jgi:branched-chain amino acid transport system permease protein
MMFMVIICGLGSILGSFLGTAFILVLPIMLDQVPHALGIPITVETVSLSVLVITGSLICYLLIVEPLGFARLWSVGKEKLRLWPYPY